jgi:hypothetical protein
VDQLQLIACSEAIVRSMTNEEDGDQREEEQAMVIKEEEAKKWRQE